MSIIVKLDRTTIMHTVILMLRAQIFALQE